MIVFLDTEFTNFASPELISIGLVSDTGVEFYAERSDFDLSRCTDFVRTVVLPKLGRFPGRVMDSSQLREQFVTWLMQFASLETMLAYDFDIDWALFVRAVGNEIPSWLTHKNVDDQINDLTREWFFVENDLGDHHALNDARANRAAYWAGR